MAVEAHSAAMRFEHGPIEHLAERLAAFGHDAYSAFPVYADSCTDLREAETSLPPDNRCVTSGRRLTHQAASVNDYVRTTPPRTDQRAWPALQSDRCLQHHTGPE